LTTKEKIEGKSSNEKVVSEQEKDNEGPDKEEMIDTSEKP